MTAKEYLNQAYRLDQRVSNKLMQIDALRSLTQQVTTRFKENVVSHTSNVTSLEDTIIRLMETETELNQQIDALVDLKRETISRISRLNNTNYQLVLEKRYLQFLTWQEIAHEMQFSLRWVHSIHKKALTAFDEVMQNQKEAS